MAYDLAGLEVSHRVLVSKEAIREITNSNDVMLMLVKVDDVSRVNAIREEIKTTLDKKHGVSGLTTVISGQGILQQVENDSRLIQAVVVSIALIALFVGCLGIINIMLMSVMERTREIGIMKAIGATKKDILTLFVVEASVISFLGGIVGVLSGVGLSVIAQHIFFKNNNNRWHVAYHFSSSSFYRHNNGCCHRNHWRTQLK